MSANPFDPGTEEHQAWERQERGAADDLAQRVHQFLGRFVAYPSSHAHVAHTLWVLHAHCMDAFESTPRIAFLSPEPGSGKTRAIEITELLVPRPVEAVNVTPAYLFRKVSDPEGRPTILYDEIDTVFGPKAKDNEEIRGLLNAGHRRGAVAGRCTVKGKTIVTEEIPAYCAVALAGLGGLPDTLLTRSVVIHMRRRAAHERVEPYRRRLHAGEGEKLRDELAAWATSATEALQDALPDMPETVTDRNADVWEPLISVADALGGEWPDNSRRSAVALVADLQRDSGSLGIRLLRDLLGVFGDRERLTTGEVITGLTTIDEAPWADLRGKPLDPRRLSRLLAEYGVKPKNVRIGGNVVKGYERADLVDPWQRYCAREYEARLVPPRGMREESGPPPSPEKSATSATSATDPTCEKCGMRLDAFYAKHSGRNRHPMCEDPQ